MRQLGYGIKRQGLLQVIRRDAGRQIRVEVEDDRARAWITGEFWPIEFSRRRSGWLVETWPLLESPTPCLVAAAILPQADPETQSKIVSDLTDLGLYDPSPRPLDEREIRTILCRAAGASADTLGRFTTSLSELKNEDLPEMSLTAFALTMASQEPPSPGQRNLRDELSWDGAMKPVPRADILMSEATWTFRGSILQPWSITRIDCRIRGDRVSGAAAFVHPREVFRGTVQFEAARDEAGFWQVTVFDLPCRGTRLERGGSRGWLVNDSQEETP